MKIRGISNIRHGINRISNLFQAHAVILLYHRIAELKPDPQLLCVSPTNFAEHLDHIRRHYKLLSLQDLKQTLISGDISKKSVILTFDDGYADNLWNAKPLLEHYNIPATVFVTSGYVDSEREFPSDCLERCMLLPKVLPDSLTLVIEGKTYSWQIDNSKENIDEWNMAMKIDTNSRQRCYRELHRLMRPLDYESRKLILEALTNWASCPTKARPEHRALNSDELKELNEDGLIEIGSHGVRHLVLATQPAELQWKDISESKHCLENILGKPVVSFAYPYGSSNDVTIQTIILVKEAGIQIACANFPSPVTERSDLFWLPRFIVRDWDKQEFAKRLRKAFNIHRI